MDPEPVPARARRLRNPLRRLAVAGIAGVAWLALSATTATADDAAGSPSLPAGTGDVATLSSVPNDKLGPTQAPTTTGLGDLAPEALAPENHVWAVHAVPEPGVPVPDPTPSATDPSLSAQAPVPAVPEPGLPVPDPTPPAAGPAAPVPASAAPVPEPTPTAADPAAPVPAAPVPEPTPPAADPGAPVPDPGVALPVVTPVGPLPGSTVPMPDSPCPGSVAAPAGSTVTAPEDAGSPTAAGTVNEAKTVLQPLASHPQAKSRLGYLRSASFPPPGSAANVTSGNPLRAGVPGSGAADPAAPSAADGGGAPAPSGPVGPSPWHEGTGLPAPNALPGAPGSGSGGGHSPTSPAGTAAGIPSLYFYLPTMDADPIRGPLQHEYSAVCADLGSSPD
jgi:hypothetical protein